MRTLKLITVIALIFGCSDIVEVEDISKKKITVLAPKEGSVIKDTLINFSWNTVEGSTQYKLQVATPKFETASQIVLDTTITSSNYTKKLLLGSYEWRVRGENVEFYTDYTTQSFTIE